MTNFKMKKFDFLEKPKIMPLCKCGCGKRLIWREVYYRYKKFPDVLLYHPHPNQTKKFTDTSKCGGKYCGGWRYGIWTYNKKEYTKDYIKKRYKEDKHFNISMRLRTLVYQALLCYTKGEKLSSNQYGIDYKKIINHLTPFPKDLSKYHIDHIQPLCSFQFINKDESINLSEIKKAFAPKNHQWLTVQENLSKGKKLKKKREKND